MLEIFLYKSPIGEWVGALFQKKLAYFSYEGMEEILKFAKKYSLQSVEIDHPPSLLSKELDLYFKGKLKKFSFPIQILFGTEFEKKVWNCLLSIPLGEVVSYAWVAQKIQNPKAVRAVGRANGKNRIPVVIPCHRVISSDGSLGGYSGGVDLKKALLQIEGITL